MPSPALLALIRARPPGTTVLDVGGWFRPLPEATHVVDRMPYETRGGQLTTAPLPGEHFTRATWTQADFLQSGFRLPFGDRAFAFVYCGHTLEDLEQPEPLLHEIMRVGQAGCICSPTRLSEQTRGVRDRTTSAPGHPHHHWIVEPVDGGLRFCAKPDSLPPENHAALLPLRHYERLSARLGGSVAGEFELMWHDHLPFAVVRGGRAAELARTFTHDQQVRISDRLLDPLVRRGRAIKYRLRHPLAPITPEQWWSHMLEISRPFSSIPLV